VVAGLKILGIKITLGLKHNQTLITNFRASLKDARGRGGEKKSPGCGWES